MLMQVFSDRKKAKIRHVLIHDAALPAYNFSTSLNRLFNNAITKNIAQSDCFCHQLTLHAVEIKPFEIQIISGFEHPFFNLASLNVSSSIIINHSSTMTDEQIARMAWINTISHRLFNSVSESSLGELHTAINKYIPTNLMLEMFAVKHVSEVKLAEMVSKTKGCIAKQKSKETLLTVPTEPSIFESVIETIK